MGFMARGNGRAGSGRVVEAIRSRSWAIAGGRRRDDERWRPSSNSRLGSKFELHSSNEVRRGAAQVSASAQRGRRWCLAVLVAVGVAAGTVATPPPSAVAAIGLPIDLMAQDGLRLVAMNDPRWGNLAITPTRTSDPTDDDPSFGGCGCWLASIATIFSFQTGFPAGSLPKFPMALDLTTSSGLDLSFSPPYFDAFASENGGYESATIAGKCGTSIKPDAFEDAANAVLDPVTSKPFSPTGLTWSTVNGFGPEVRARVDRYLTRGWPVAVRTEREVTLDDGSTKPISHMQMIVGYEPRPDGTGSYLVLDPSAYGATGPEAESFVFEGYDEDGAWAATVKDVRFVEPVYANSTWFGIFDDPEPIEIVVTDPLGRRMGVDPRTGVNHNEQPTGSYERTNGWADPLGISPAEDDQKRYWTRNPVDGVYAIEVIGTGTGDWTLDVWNGGDTITQTLTGSTTAGETDRYTVRLQGGRVVEVTPVADFSVRADAGPDQTTIPGVEVRVDGYRSWAPTNAPISSYSWDFGDGSPVAVGRSASHTYATAGTYAATLTVTDTNGASATDTLTVRAITPPPPGRVTSMVTESPTDPGKSLKGGSSVVTPAGTADGRYVAFASPHVLTGDPTGAFVLYRKDTTTGGIEQLIAPDPGLRNIEDISADGQLITFVTTTAHVAADVNTRQDVYLINASTRAIELIGLADDDTPYPSEFTSGGSMSADGRYVMFGGPTDGTLYSDGIFQRFGRPDVLLRDRQLGTTRLLSIGLTGAASSGASYPGGLSDDGNVVAFSTFAGSLVGSSGSFPNPVVVTRDLAANTQRIIDLGGNSRNVYPVDVSADGRYVALLSNGQAPFTPDQQTSLVIPEPFLYDRTTRTTTHLAPPVDGNRSRVGGSSGAYAIDISDNAQWVAFTHRAPDIVPGDTNGTPDVFVYETATGMVTRESVRTDGGQSAGSVTFPTGSPSIDNLAIDDSGAVVFESNAADLTPEIVNQSSFNVFRRGPAVGGSNGQPVAELGGPYLGFASTPEAPTGIRLDGTRSVDPEGGALTGQIDAGDGSDSLTGLAGTHRYGSSGTYTATIIVSDGARTGNDTATVDVLPAPLADTVYVPACAAPGATIAVGGIVRTANAKILSEGWDTSQGPAPLAAAQLDLSWRPPIKVSSTLPDLSITTVVTLPDAPGSYSVGLAETSESATITVPCPVPAPLPVADAGGPYRVVAGEPLQLDGTGSAGAQSYAWMLGDGNSANGSAPIYTYTTPGTYIIQLVVGDTSGGEGAARLQEAVPGVSGRTSDTSVFASRSRAVVQVTPAQAPPTEPTVTTSVLPTTLPPATTATTAMPAPVATTTTVPAVPSLDGLPSTGGNSRTKLALAVALVGVGALLVVLARRRTTAG